MKHTPPPWRVTEKQHPTLSSIVQFRIDSPTRALMFLGEVWNKERPDDPTPLEEVRANFTLASCAPDLLEALEWIVANASSRRWNACREKARAALAKVPS